VKNTAVYGPFWSVWERAYIMCRPGARPATLMVPCAVVVPSEAMDVIVSWWA
jgi:hypothetical protein